MNPYKKKYWLLSFVILMLVYGKSKAQGIDFMPAGTSWAQALQTARDSNKLIFVDVYTEWCGPCKTMDKEIFPLEAVGKKYNASFVNYKLDAEKGMGPALKSQYRVISYPTYLFVKSNGTLIYRTNSSMTAAAFLREADNALKEAKNPVTLVQLDSIYQSGNREKQFLYTYLKKRLQLKQDNVELLEYYAGILTAEEQTDTLNLQLIADNGHFLMRSLKLGKALDLLMQYGSKIGLSEEELSGIQSTAIDKTFSLAVQQKNKTLLQQVFKANQKNDDDFRNNNKALQAGYDFQTKNYPAYLRSATVCAKWLMHFSDATLDSMDKQVYDRVVPELRTADMSAAEREYYIQSYKRTQSIQVIRGFEDICSKVIQSKPDKQALTNAAVWSKRMIYLLEKDTAYYQYVYPTALKTYAEVLYANHRTPEAIRFLEKAVVVTQDEKRKTACNELLNKWKQNKDNKTAIK